jgi:hypothetical protein
LRPAPAGRDRLPMLYLPHSLAETMSPGAISRSARRSQPRWIKSGWPNTRTADQYSSPRNLRSVRRHQKLTPLLPHRPMLPRFAVSPAERSSPNSTGSETACSCRGSALPASSTAACAKTRCAGMTGGWWRLMTRADPRSASLPQLERRLEQVRVQPSGSIEPGQGLRRALPGDRSRRADSQSRRSSVRPRPDHSSVGPRARDLQALLPGPEDGRFVHE